MRIVHVISYFQPELGYQETNLALAQARDGHDVCVLTSDRYAPGLYPSVQPILGNRIKGAGYFEEEGIKTYRLPVFVELLGQVWIRGLSEKLLRLDPDLVVVHSVVSIPSIQVSLLSKKLPRAKIIFDDHMVYVANRPWTRFLYLMYKLLFTRKILNVASALIAVSDETKEFMENRYGIPPGRIDIVPLGCDATLFQRNLDSRKELRELHKVAESDTLFVYAGKLVPPKGLHILVEAAIGLLRNNHRAKVMLVGNGPREYVEKIHSKIRASGFQDSFIFLPMVPNKDLSKVYSAGDVGVWPRQCSLTMIEAMACGLPVIISDASGAIERVNHGNGLLYHGEDPDDLQRKMKILLDKKTRETISKKAREFAEGHDWCEISRRFLKASV